MVYMYNDLLIYIRAMHAMNLCDRRMFWFSNQRALRSFTAKSILPVGFR